MTLNHYHLIFLFNTTYSKAGILKCGVTSPWDVGWSQKASQNLFKITLISNENFLSPWTGLKSINGKEGVRGSQRVRC